MFGRNFLRRWFGPRPGTIRNTAPKRSSLSVKPQLEQLETRLVMTANVSLTAGVLKAVCDNKATTVTLSHSGTTTTLAGQSFADADISRIEISGGRGQDTILVRDTPAVPVLVNAGGGDDVIEVGSTANLLSSIQGALTVRGTTGNDSLVLHDEGSTVGRTYTVTATSVSRSGAARITYSNTTESVRLEAGLGNDKVRVNSLPTVTGIVVNGGAGVNSLVGPVADTAWQIDQTNGGSLNAGAVSFSNFANLTGGAGADTFLLADGQGISGVIDGGGGVNTLDYGAYTTGVSVNLADGTATNVAGGIRNIQNALGGVGDDVLVGTEGDNVLDGRDGVDQLDGRGGNDTLLNGEDPANPNLGSQVVEFALANLDTQVGGGECTDLAMAALQAAGAKTTDDFGVTGPDADYVWGTLIVTYRPGDALSALDGVQAGDIIQYRDVTITSDFAWFSAYHHTAVVQENHGNGLFTILEQNVNDERWVHQNTMDLSGMTGGVLWIYRPVAR
jgi:Ca2+-binding RTX toxin-like protein